MSSTPPTSTTHRPDLHTAHSSTTMADPTPFPHPHTEEDGVPIGTGAYSYLSVRDIGTYDTQYEEFGRRAKSFANHLPSHALNFLASLFPVAEWMPRYNRDWLWGDLIAGATVGIVVVPQVRIINGSKGNHGEL